MNFDYNGKGERVNKFGVGTARPSHYVYNESGAVAILQGAGKDPANSGVQNIIYIDQLPVGVLDNGLLLPIETDHLGTPRVVSDGNQAIWRWDLITGNASTGGSNAFGDRPANQVPDGNGKSYRFDLRFPGQIHDPETQLNYNYFRDYEPGTGRYVESDPIGLRGDINTFAYVRGRPARYTDSKGLFTVEPCKDNHCDTRYSPAQVAQSAQQACDETIAQVTDVGLAYCLKYRCKNSKIVCDPSCHDFGGFDCGQNVNPGGHVIRVCVNTETTHMAQTILHELAHSCGWHHGDGMGVPRDPGSTPGQKRCPIKETYVSGAPDW